MGLGYQDALSSTQVDKDQDACFNAGYYGGTGECCLQQRGRHGCKALSKSGFARL